MTKKWGQIHGKLDQVLVSLGVRVTELELPGFYCCLSLEKYLDYLQNVDDRFAPMLF